MKIDLGKSFGEKNKSAKKCQSKGLKEPPTKSTKKLNCFNANLIIRMTLKFKERRLKFIEVF